MQTQSQNLTSFVLDLSKQNKHLQAQVVVLREALTQTLNEYEQLCHASGISPFTQVCIDKTRQILVDDNVEQLSLQV